MVFSEGFKDILNLKHILKVILSSNYVLMVGLLAKGKRVPWLCQPNVRQQEPVPSSPQSLVQGVWGGVGGKIN